MSGLAITKGVEFADLSGAHVQVSGVAKTVADCIRFRNKIGLDVGLEALREVWSGMRVTMDELWRYPEICRIANVTRQYLEAVGAA